MKTHIHEVTLLSDQHFNGKLPPHYLGYLFADLPLAIRDSISMALRNRSVLKGRRPAWIDRASDIRFSGHSGNGQTTLIFEAPALGDAAREVYDQKSFFPELRPDPRVTGFDLFGDVLADIQRRNDDSEHFDHPLLKRVIGFGKFFGTRRAGPFRGVQFSGHRYAEDRPVVMTSETIQSAQSLLGTTPASQRVRLVGNLDGLEASTQRFSLVLESGDKVVGVFAEDQFDEIHHLWRKRVLVLGTAVFRPSGRLLRVDAESVVPGDAEPSLFSRLPTPSHAKLDLSKLRRPQGPRSGLSAIVGKWPGDESDEEVNAALEQLS